MLAYRHAVREAAKRLAAVAHKSVIALRQKRVEHEPAMTDRFLGAAEVLFEEEFEIKGICWSAKTLTDRGARSQEREFGADFLGVLNIALPDFSVAKGFLAQAKLLRNGSIGDVQELKDQCEKMLRHTPAAFVFLYSERGMRVLPAVSVLGAAFDPLQVYSRSAQRFFEEHLQSFIGDRSISTATPATLEALRNRYQARITMAVKGGD